jgi:two-component system chemotaxis sensor kinase CheA
LQAFDLVRAMAAASEVLADPGLARTGGRAMEFGPPGGQRARPEDPGPDPVRDQAPERIESVTIPARELDVLVDRIGELGIAQARLESLARRSGGREFLAVAEETGRLAGLLRDQALGLRLLPLQVGFLKYRRLVRDACARLGKEADLVLSGENTELDKTLIERLNTPVLHLLRNAVDHGIEPPAVRLAAGKPARGRIVLSARQEGNEAVIEVADDGAGIDADALWEAACARGLADPGRPLSREERLRLVFAPGLSTARDVGQMSGRGVGMDAAREGIESLRGTIGIDSAPGRGTVFVIRLPCPWPSSTAWRCGPPAGCTSSTWTMWRNAWRWSAGRPRTPGGGSSACAASPCPWSAWPSSSAWAAWIRPCPGRPTRWWSAPAQGASASWWTRCSGRNRPCSSTWGRPWDASPASWAAP